MPLFHEARISLELVDLNAAHLLLPHSRHLLVLVVAASRIVCLSLRLLVKLLQVSLNVELLLRLIESVNARLEELMLNSVVLLLRVGNFLSRLVIAELASFSEHGDVCSRVDLLEAHFELVEKAQG